MHQKTHLPRVWQYLKRAQMWELRRKGKTLQEIADIFGVSREYIRQVLGNKSKNSPPYKQPKIKKTLELKIFERIQIVSKSECWEYHGPKNPVTGYGVFNSEGKTFLAHRIAYKILNGKYDESLCVLHKCDNQVCCNPYHLFLGTQADNNADRDAKLRTGHKYTEDEVRKFMADRLNGMSYAKIAKKYNMNTIVVWQILTGKIKIYRRFLS